MTSCPQCQSIDCVSNKFKNVPLQKIAGSAMTAPHPHRISHAISEFMVWLGIDLGNHFRDDWKCNFCGHTF